MYSACWWFVVLVGLAANSFAAPRQHTVALGRWRVVNAVTDDGHPQQVKVRALYVDRHFREYAAGIPHDVTDRMFVIRRARRVNDSLPTENGKKPRWVWQLDGWLSIDRLTGRIAQLNFPAFDPEVSQASWYRDYAAYCGRSDDGDTIYMVVVQLGRRKPLLKKEFASDGCSAPLWERNPTRVTFKGRSEKNSFVVRAHSAIGETESESGEGPE